MRLLCARCAIWLHEVNTKQLSAKAWFVLDIVACSTDQISIWVSGDDAAYCTLCSNRHSYNQPDLFTFPSKCYTTHVRVVHMLVQAEGEQHWGILLAPRCHFYRLDSTAPMALGMYTQSCPIYLGKDRTGGEPCRTSLEAEHHEKLTCMCAWLLS